MSNYLVRALSPIEADNPVEAVETYQKQLVQVPLEDWVYRVESRDSGEMFYVYKGEVYTLTGLSERFGVDPPTPPGDMAERVKAAKQTAESEPEDEGP